MKIYLGGVFPLFEKTEVLSTQHRNCLIHWDINPFLWNCKKA